MIISIQDCLIGERVFIRKTESKVTTGMIGTVAEDEGCRIVSFPGEYGEDNKVTLVERVGDTDIIALAQNVLLSGLSSQYGFPVVNEERGHEIRKEWIDECFNRLMGNAAWSERIEVGVIDLLAVMMLSSNSRKISKESLTKEEQSVAGATLDNFNISDISQIAKVAHLIAAEKGFWEGRDLSLGEKLMLIVSELSEALEADRLGRRASVRGFVDAVMHNEGYEEAYKKYIKDTVEDELAGSALRIFDLCGNLGLDVDISWHICAAMKFSSLRPYKHGKKY